LLSSQSLKLEHVSRPASDNQTPPTLPSRERPPPRREAYGIAKRKPTGMALFILA